MAKSGMQKAEEHRTSGAVRRIGRPRSSRLAEFLDGSRKRLAGSRADAQRGSSLITGRPRGSNSASHAQRVRSRLFAGRDGPRFPRSA